MSATTIDPTDLQSLQYGGRQMPLISNRTNTTSNTSPIAKTSKTKKRDHSGSQLKKAPQAPKRFKSSYICFFMASRPETKIRLGPDATIAEISKESANLWRNMSADEKSHWETVAAKDKERYMSEKASYTGPWQVPQKRARKDPSSPKRPMSAFLYFALGKRTALKRKHTGIPNKDISRLLGQLWRTASEEERKPYVEKEQQERILYKEKMKVWKQEQQEKEEREHKRRVDQQHAWSAEDLSSGGPTTNGRDLSSLSYFPPNNYAYPYPGGNAFTLPTNGVQPVILGPNGMPHGMTVYSPLPQAAPPMVLFPPAPAPSICQPPPLNAYDEGDDHPHPSEETFDFPQEQIPPPAE